jgi:hypothetical protein
LVDNGLRRSKRHIEMTEGGQEQECAFGKSHCMEVREMFNIRMVLEADGQVFTLHLSRIENGVVYFGLDDTGVQIQQDGQRRELVGAVGGQPEETQTISPGAEEGDEALQPQDAIERRAAGAPGGPEGEGVEPTPPAGRRGAGRGFQGRRGRR